MHINGRHITAMVIAVSAAAILTPVSVGAATGTWVNIRDPLSTAAGTQARVSSGALAVSEELNSFTRYGDIYSGAGGTISITVPANKTLRIGTLSAAHTFGSSDIRVSVAYGKPNTTCAATGRSNYGYPIRLQLSPGEQVTQNYAPMITLPRRSFTTCVDVFVVGPSPDGSGAATITGTIS